MLVRAGVCLVGTSKQYDLLACSIVSCWHACLFHNVVLNAISTTTSVYEVNV